GDLDDPRFRDPVRDAPPREGVAVVVVEPARPAPADAARLDADPSGVEVEHGEPVAGRRLHVAAIDPGAPDRAEEAVVAGRGERVAEEEALGGDQEVGN